MVAALAGAYAATPRKAATVRKEKQENAQKIKNLKNQINSNLDDIRRQVAQLQTLNAQMQKSNAAVKTLSHRVDTLERHVAQLSDSIEATQKRIHSLTVSLEKALVTIRKQRQSASTTAFIFASKSFSEARKKARYVSELSLWESEKAEALKQQNELLKQQQNKLQDTHRRLAANLEELTSKRDTLKMQRTESDKIVEKLKKQGRNLDKALAEQQRQAKKLDEELNKIIEEEARKKGSEAPGDMPSDFAQAQGKLPMPVSGNSMIVSEFGKHSHKDYEKVELMNNGIDIEATPGAKALAVFDGVVTMVTVMDGYRNVVLVRHGNYITVYAGIDKLSVRKGDKVKTGQELGTIHSDKNDSARTRLHFEIRHEKEKLDPAQWLR